MALTVPTNAASCLSNWVETAATSSGVMQIDSPIPTSTQRVYDVWRATNLVGAPVWQALGLNVHGASNGAAVSLRVTNTLPGAFYRTGVKLP